MPAETETLAACLTPAGSAAIATLAVRGPLAWAVVSGLFTPRLLERPDPGSLHLGTFGDDLRDQVVLAVKADSIEIHCHGGTAVVQSLLAALSRRGARVCGWPEFESRCSSPLNAMALEALSQARTPRTAAILLDQVAGAFERALRFIPEAADAEVQARFDELARHVALGRRLVEPFRVVVAGAPNAGKSSLVNALAGYQRTVVSPVPGTTRDLVATVVAIDGWPVELIDTAGQRRGAVGLEEKGIALAREAGASADLSLWLVDGSAPFPGMANAGTAKLVISKADLPPAWDWESLPDAPRVSSWTGAGLDDLCQRLSKWLVPDPPAAGAAVPFHPALCECIEGLGGEPAEIVRRELGRLRERLLPEPRA